MSRTATRRDALRYLGALALARSGLMAGCSSSERLELAQDSIDPAQPWWMQRNYAPVLQERELESLRVVGEIPAALRGVYLRNGPNPKHGDRGHYFLGDGMLHAIRVSDGRAEWYRNRWVQTRVLDTERTVRDNPQDDLRNNFSNVSLVHHAGRLLSLGEVGIPYEISVPNLTTVGPYDYAGRLATFMTGHPKLDPLTGELHFFGYGLSLPHLTYHLVSANGELVRSEPIHTPRATMMHDFQITRGYVVFLDLPIVFDLKLALANAPFPFRWMPDNGARIGLMPRPGSTSDVIWLDVEPCFVFHTWNAYEDATGKVILEVCRYPQLWVNDSTHIDARPTPHRFTLDPLHKTVREEQLDERSIDLPRIDDRLTGLEHRYAYGLLGDDDFDYVASGPRIRAIVKYDRRTRSVSMHDFGLAREPGEALFVPSAPGCAEDEGFLLTFVYDHRSGTSSLEILDARAPERAALASVELPVRVPAGAHGLWLPDGNAA